MMKAYIGIVGNAGFKWKVISGKWKTISEKIKVISQKINLKSFLFLVVNSYVSDKSCILNYSLYTFHY